MRGRTALLCAVVLPSTLAATPAAGSNVLHPAHSITLDTANGLAQNGRQFCTELAEPVQREPFLGTGSSGTCEVVVAAYGQSASEYELMRMLMPPKCKITVYDKDDKPCAFMPLSGIDKCSSLPNVGREQHTWAHYARTHYGDYPDVMFFVPADLPAHDRAHSVQLMLNSTVFNSTHPGAGQTGAGFWCIDRTAGKLCDGFKEQVPTNLANCSSCAMNQYCRGGNGSSCVRPTPTVEADLQGYLQANVGTFSAHTMDRLCHLPLCHYGVIATTKENLLSHPIEVYASIEDTLNKTMTPEAIWMMEWGLGAAYGIKGAREKSACGDGYPYAPHCPFPVKPVAPGIPIAP